MMREAATVIDAAAAAETQTETAETLELTEKRGGPQERTPGASTAADRR